MALRVSYPIFKAYKQDGTFANSYKLYTYTAGTSTPQTAWKDAAKAQAHTNPIILNSLGEAEIFLDGNYKFVLTDELDAVQPGWPVDNITETTVTAAEVTILPSGDMAGTNVQAIIDEIIISLADKLDAADYDPGIDELVTGVSLSGGFAGLSYEMGTDTEHDIDFKKGSCRSADNLATIKQVSDITKQIDAVWAAGSNVGMMSPNSSLLPDTMYSLYAISGESGTDWICVEDGENIVTEIAAITGVWTYYRRRGLIRTNASSNIIPFVFDPGNNVMTFTDRSAMEIISATAAPSGISTPIDVSSFIIEGFVTALLIGGHATAAECNAALSSDGVVTHHTVRVSYINNTSNDCFYWYSDGQAMFLPLQSTNIYWGDGTVASTGNVVLAIHKMQLFS